MKITCPKCGHSAEVDDLVIPEGATSVRCHACDNRFPLENKFDERIERWEWEQLLPCPSFASKQDGHPRKVTIKPDKTSAEDRHSGAHSDTAGTEFSWNIPDSSKTYQKEGTPNIDPKASSLRNRKISPTHSEPPARKYPSIALPQEATRKPLWAWVFVVLSLIFGILETIIAIYLSKILLTPDPLGVGGYLFLLFSPLIGISIVLAILQLRASYYVLKLFKDNIPKKLTILSAILNAPIILICIGFIILPIVSLLYN